MVAILLSTYNGEMFLKEQIESIFSQTFTDWKIFIRDDGSSDNTLKIINEYKTKEPNKIQILTNEHETNLGASKSFMRLLQLVEADYYMFCDQDDYWLKNKIQLMLSTMSEFEKQKKNTPILIISDLLVVDHNLDIISDSFWRFSNLNPFIIVENFLEVTNCVTGCATFFNKEARDVTIKNAENIDVIMHDYWLSICVKGANGIIHPIKEKTIYYRQHGKNVIGA